MVLEALSLLSRRKWHIIIPAVLGLAVALLISRIQIPSYEAQAALEVQGIRQTFKETSAPAGPAQYLQNQAARLLKSRTMIDRAKKRVLQDAASPTNPNRLQPEQRALMGVLPLPAVTLEQAVAIAADTLHVSAAPDHMVLDITCESTMPEVAAGFANALIDEYIKWNTEERWNTYRDTSEWLVNAQNALRDKLHQSEQKLRDYANTTNLVRTADAQSGQAPNVAAQRLRDLQQELSRAEADRIFKEAQLRAATASTPESLSQMAGGTSASNQYQIQLAELRRQLADLSSSLTPAHYKVKRVEAQIAELEATLAKEREAILERLRRDYEATQHRENTFRAEYVRQTARVTSETDKLDQYNILKQEVDINRQLYDAILKRSEEASIESALRSTNSRIVDRATPADSPSKPNPPLYCGVGFLSGMLFAAAFVLGREWTDRTLKAPGDAMTFLDLRELGAIPNTSADEGMRRMPAHVNSIGAEMNLETRIGHDRRSRSRIPIEFATWARKSSFVAESFRIALTSIGKWSGRILMVTSPGPREGKTAVVANLAVAIAESGGRVLLIDADLRRPRLHNVFGLENTIGLASLLTGETSMDRIEDIICQTELPQLSLLPAGKIPASQVAALFHSPRLPQLLTRLRRHYEVILFDTPPMLPVSDARMVGRVVDGTLLVVRAKQTTRQAAGAALYRLKEDCTPVIGAILNDWNPNTVGYGNYGTSYAETYY